MEFSGDLFDRCIAEYDSRKIKWTYVVPTLGKASMFDADISRFGPPGCIRKLRAGWDLDKSPEPQWSKGRNGKRKRPRCQEGDTPRKRLK
jgi:hypothetical protein